MEKQPEFGGGMKTEVTKRSSTDDKNDIGPGSQSADVDDTGEDP